MSTPDSRMGSESADRSQTTTAPPQPLGAAEVEELKRRTRRLEAQLEVARARLADESTELEAARSQLRRLRSRKVLRLVDAVGAVRRNPKRVKTLPRTIGDILRGTSPRSGGSAPAASTPTVQVGSPRALDTAPRRQVDRLADLRVAGILDTFSASCFGPEADLELDTGPADWRSRVKEQEPDLLLVESAWQGNAGRWQYQVGSYTYPETAGLPALVELLRWCHEHDVPTVFWNKEDPVHFDKFREAAALFDVVLTTDADRIDAYRALPGSRASQVAALPFAAQPRIHHPFDEPWPRDPAPVFAGTYYRNRHEDRKAQLEMLLDAARDHGLVIFDRMAGRHDESVGFPERFLPHVQGGLPYDEMVEAYRRYRLFLNTNSVTASPTMFSRRVFELLASGTPVVSTPSAGMEAMLGHVVRSVRTADEAQVAVGELQDPATWQATRLEGLRTVLREHTYAHRLAQIAELVGIDADPYPNEGVTLIVPRTPARDVSGLHDAAGDLPALFAADADIELPRGHALDAGGTTRDRIRRLSAAAPTPWVLLVDDAAPLDRARLDDLLLARRAAPAADVVGLGGDNATTSVPPAGVLLVRRDLAAAHGVDPSDPAGTVPEGTSAVTYPAGSDG